MEKNHKSDALTELRLQKTACIFVYFTCSVLVSQVFQANCLLVSIYGIRLEGIKVEVGEKTFVHYKSSKEDFYL